MTRMQQEFDLAVPRPRAPTDIAFEDRSLLVRALPVRRPAPQDGWTGVHQRAIGPYAVRILTPSVPDAETGEPVAIGAPWGPKGRLVLLALARAAREVSDRSPVIEFGNIRDWMTASGISLAGDNVETTKDQLIRLSYSLFDCALRRPGQNIGYRHELFIRDAALSARELRYFRAGQLNKVLWPKAVHLTDAGLKRLRNDIVAAPPARLRDIGNSTVALDMFLHLAHRLPRLSARAYELWGWDEIRAQFPHGGRSQTKAQLVHAFKAALTAYPEAVVEDHADGILLFRSPPATSPLRVMVAGHSFQPEEAVMRQVT